MKMKQRYMKVIKLVHEGGSDEERDKRSIDELVKRRTQKQDEFKKAIEIDDYTHDDKIKKNLTGLKDMLKTKQKLFDDNLQIKIDQMEHKDIK
jgi:UDP-N-acetylmuramate-alanine ligase